MKNKILFALSLFCLTALSQEIGIKIENMDKTADPRNDFYSYCNGTWQKTFKLPESDSRYGSFNEINDNNLKNIKSILDAASKNKIAAKGSDAQKLRDFYNTAMDSVKADKAGIDPIKTQLEQIEKVNSLNDFIVLKTEFDFIGINLLFNGGVSADLKNSRKNLYGFSQAGFGLGNRDFYYSDKFESIRAEYAKYLTELFVLAGSDENSAKNNANFTLKFERQITEAALTNVQMRDPEKLYNIYTPASLNKLSPSINWLLYFKSIGIQQPDTMVVSTVDYFKVMDDILKHTSVQNLKTYARAQLLMEAAPYLSDKFVQVNFNFRGKTLSGAKQMKPRWQRVEQVIDRTIGDLLAKDYVSKYFPPQSKQKVLKLIDNLVLAYRERIASRTWMSDETKKQAYRKLDLLIKKVGYPETWRNYSTLNITTGSFWQNVAEANKLLVKENIADLKKPVDRKKWLMTATTVNAYYQPSTNEITFPAAILQPPFFNPKAEDAANYGTMGAIIGHELTHGFDDQGAQFDADGNMKMWWTETDYKNFKEKTQLVVDQFNNYIAIDTMHVNGNMTQGENIADLGGLTMAYYAYKKSLNGKSSTVMNGFTGEQRFYIAWAQGWKTVTRDAELKRLLTIDYHSPGYFRAFAPLSNLKEFYEAFNVKEGDKMFTPENRRAEIW